MAYKLKYNLFHWLFRLFSFLSDRTGGWRLFVKPKLFWGLLVLGLSATACNPKENKSKSVHENLKENDSISENINSQTPESEADSSFIDDNDLISCYELVAPAKTCQSNKFDTTYLHTDSASPPIKCYVMVVIPSELPDTTTNEKKIFAHVEQMPSFPDGEKALMRFIFDNLKIPPIMCYDSEIASRVVCRFVVNEDGSISDIQILKSADSLIDKEAVRVIESMPKWIPGKQNGENVRTYYTIPISLHLQ